MNDNIKLVVDVAGKGALKTLAKIETGFLKVDKAAVKATKTAAKVGASIAALAAGTAVVGGLALIAKGLNDIDSASKKMGAGVNASGKQLKDLKDSAKEIYAANLGENIAESFDVVTQTFREMGDVGKEEITYIASQALKLKDAFGGETQSSIQAAKTLMKNFAIDSTQAFDFIAAGYQRGLDGSGDFIDSINEYATQFSSAGADAGQFFSVMETGAAGGTLGIDKAADAFKEFRLRIINGSTATADGLKAIGINADQFTAKIASGAITTAQAWDVVTGKLRATTDAGVRLQAGAALIGTQYEDLGDSAVAAIDMTKTTMNDLSGASDKLNVQYGTMGGLLQGLGREFSLAVTGALEQSDAVGIITGKIQELKKDGRLQEFFKEIGVIAVEVFASVVEGIGYIPAAFFTVQKVMNETIAFFHAMGEAALTTIQYILAATNPVDALGVAINGLDATFPTLAAMKENVAASGQEFMNAAMESEKQKQKYVEMGEAASELAEKIRNAGTEAKNMADAKPVEIDIMADPGDFTDYVRSLKDGSADALPDKPIDISVDAELTKFSTAIGTTIQKINGTWVEVPVDADDAKAKFKIADLVRTETKTIYIKTVEQKAIGGRVGMAAGGRFPGNSKVDSVHVMARPGEGFTRNEALSVWDKKVGAGFFEGVNNPWGTNGRRIMDALIGASPRLQVAVPSAPKSSFASGGRTSQPANLGTVNIKIGGKTHQGLYEPDVAKSLTRELQRLQKLRPN